MATFLLRALAGSPQLNSSHTNAVIVSAVADESAARSTANAAAPNGESKVGALWIATQLAAGDIAPTLIWFEGRAVVPSLGDRFRGA